MNEANFKFLYVVKKYKTTKTDDGWREVYYNDKTQQFKFKHVVGFTQKDSLHNSPKVFVWDWD